MNTTDLEKFSKDLAAKSSKAKRKAMFFTIVPFFVGLAWMIFSGYQANQFSEKAEANKKISDSLAERVKKYSKQGDSILSVFDSTAHVLDSIRSQVNTLVNNIPRLKDSTQFENVQSSLSSLIGQYSSIKFDTLSKLFVQQKQITVYIQVASADGKAHAQKLVAEIRDLEYTVPQVEIMNRNNFDNHVQYYHAEDSLAAKQVLAKCQKIYNENFRLTLYNGNGGKNVIRKYKAPAGQVEVWIKQ